MNIHLKDVNDFNTLKRATVVTVRFGSFRYGLQSETSDIDEFNIYIKSDNMSTSIVKPLNNYQYKSNNTDHIFCALDDFILDLLHGNSTVSFEVLHLLDGTDLQWLYDMRHSFYNYENARSYLGVAKRDCKYYKENDKKLAHAYRSVEYAKQIMSGEFGFDLGKEKQQKLLDLRFGTYNRDMMRADITTNIMIERDTLNIALENKSIHRKVSLDDLCSIQTLLQDTIETHRIDYHLDLGSQYDAYLNGVSYD